MLQRQKECSRPSMVIAYFTSLRLHFAVTCSRPFVNFMVASWFKDTLHGGSLELDQILRATESKLYWVCVLAHAADFCRIPVIAGANDKIRYLTLQHSASSWVRRFGLDSICITEVIHFARSKFKSNFRLSQHLQLLKVITQEEKIQCDTISDKDINRTMKTQFYNGYRVMFIYSSSSWGGQTSRSHKSKGNWLEWKVQPSGGEHCTRPQ